LLESKTKGAAIKMADFGLAIEMREDQKKGWFGELQSYRQMYTVNRITRTLDFCL